MTEPGTPTESSTDLPENPETDLFPDSWDEAPEGSGNDPLTPGDPAPAIPSQPPL